MSRDLGTENLLGLAASGYLRSAKLQPVAWMEWGEEAFATAARENKPVLLDIGAVWCHWCHVMDRESYENAETAALINEHFVAVKVDRDERPDVDARYQAAVSAISGQGGWPLTAFLTPDGRPYFGGTYFPPVERYGRPSFQRVLSLMADAYEARPEEVDETAGSVMAAIEQNESFSGRGGGLDEELLRKLVASAVAQFDERNGGFGSQPKFPHPGALDLLMDLAGRESSGSPDLQERETEGTLIRKVVEVTLGKMAAGGIHDHLAGGFHRYSVDERWVVPHFEKMAYDNSELLRVYAHAYSAFGQAACAEVAKGVVRWMDGWLSDRELGGFYGSQDADDSLEDDGDYFTWTLDEAQAVLTAEEFAVAAKHFNLRAVGDMHHNPQKCVLHVVGGAEGTIPLMDDEGAHEWGTQDLLGNIKAKMYAARLQRRTPYVDKTVYTGWNGMCISAYLAAGRALGMPEVVEFGLRSLDRVLAEAWSAELGLAHVVAYGEGVSGSRIAGVLEDYGFVANAALDAWEATGELRYFAAAQEIAEAMVARFHDAGEGGFYDAEMAADAIGALKARRKPLQDSPTPAGNSVASMVLLRLHGVTGKPEYEAMARGTLEAFAGVVEHFGLYAASYGLALRLAVSGPVQVCVIGDDAAADEMEAAALKGFAANKSVVRLRASQMEALPPVLAETLPKLGGSESVAVVCRWTSCLPPVGTAEGLAALLGATGVREGAVDL